MSEAEVIDIIKAQCDKTLSGYSVVVLTRDATGVCSGYDAQIAVITKDGAISPRTVFDLQEHLHEAGVVDIRVQGTEKNIKDISFEFLKLEATIREA